MKCFLRLVYYMGWKILEPTFQRTPVITRAARTWGFWFNGILFANHTIFQNVEDVATKVRSLSMRFPDLIKIAAPHMHKLVVVVQVGVPALGGEDVRDVPSIFSIQQTLPLSMANLDSSIFRHLMVVVLSPL